MDWQSKRGLPRGGKKAGENVRDWDLSPCNMLLVHTCSFDSFSIVISFCQQLICQQPWQCSRHLVGPNLLDLRVQFPLPPPKKKNLNVKTNFLMEIGGQQGCLLCSSLLSFFCLSFHPLPSPSSPDPLFSSLFFRASC